ncbi:hypothetical protein M5K25_020237 [Dendrobium thyrsiflorum]|uniref:Uncharacterized protein n=1 Tax=Dendrobium thyrsiflorum TaxID=117978 RepID=A0ABD0U9D7_DENTH
MAASKARGSVGRNTNSEIRRSENEVEIIEEKGGMYGERHGYGGHESRGANWERKEGDYERWGSGLWRMEIGIVRGWVKEQESLEKRAVNRLNCLPGTTAGWKADTKAFWQDSEEHIALSSLISDQGKMAIRRRHGRLFAAASSGIPDPLQKFARKTPYTPPDHRLKALQSAGPPPNHHLKALHSAGPQPKALRSAQGQTSCSRPDLLLKARHPAQGLTCCLRPDVPPKALRSAQGPTFYLRPYALLKARRSTQSLTSYLRTEALLKARSSGQDPKLCSRPDAPLKA